MQESIIHILSTFEDVLLRMVDAFYRIRPQPFPGRERLEHCRIVSHRGERDNQRVFENSISAFERAESAGVWGIELDLRWTRDLQPVVNHDPDLMRVFGKSLRIADVTFTELRERYPQVPSLEEVIRRFGKRMHLMVEIKEEIYPDPIEQNHILKALFAPLKPQAEYHLLSLSDTMFGVVDFAPRSLCLPVSQLNYGCFSQLAVEKAYGGIAGHYALLSKRFLKKHHALGQKVGTGYIGSKNCLFRELNRGVDWIFSNNAADIQAIVNKHIDTYKPEG